VRAIEQTGRVIQMPVTDAQLVDLRLKYEAAFSAYQSCVLALEVVWRAGEIPQAQLLERHAAALRELNAERTRYRDALVRVAFLSDDSPH
jgi:hypothetical protein